MQEKVRSIVLCVTFGAFLLIMMGLCLFLPKKDYSDSERRQLADMPQLNADNVWDGSFMPEFEEYALDAFPFRDSFRMAKALSGKYLFARMDNNGIYEKDGYAAAMEYPLNEASVERAAERFTHIYEEYLKEAGAKVYLSVIPDKNYFMEDSGGRLSMDYDKLTGLLQADMEYAAYIDIFDLLELSDYYRTDTHWRQENIPDVAKRLTEQMNVPFQSEYTRETLEKDFYGVYYGQLALPLAPDSLVYLTNEELKQCLVYDYENDREISVYDMEKAYGKDPYEIYLSGPLSLITIENPSVENNRELIIFRDSFASSLAPLLAGSYEKITLVDIRYIHSNILANYIEFENRDVLFLYSTLVLNNSETIK